MLIISALHIVEAYPAFLKFLQVSNLTLDSCRSILTEFRHIHERNWLVIFLDYGPPGNIGNVRFIMGVRQGVPYVQHFAVHRSYESLLRSKNGDAAGVAFYSAMTEVPYIGLVTSTENFGWE